MPSHFLLQKSNRRKRKKTEMEENGRKRKSRKKRKKRKTTKWARKRNENKRKSGKNGRKWKEMEGNGRKWKKQKRRRYGDPLCEILINGLSPEHCGRRPPQQREPQEATPSKAHHFCCAWGAQKILPKYCRSNSPKSNNTQKSRTTVWLQSYLGVPSLNPR